MIFAWDIKYKFGIDWDIVTQMQDIITHYEDKGAEMNIYVASLNRTWDDQIQITKRWSTDYGYYVMQVNKDKGSPNYGIWFVDIGEKDKNEIIDKIIAKVCKRFIIEVVDNHSVCFSFIIKRKRRAKKLKNI